MISYDEFKKVEIRAGKILSAEKVPDTDKLLKLMVDFGEFEEAKIITDKVSEGGEVSGDIVAVENNKISKPRQIVSGISLYFPDLSKLVGKTCMFVTNLEPRIIKGLESNGMLFAVSTENGGFSLLEPNDSIPAGTLAK
jgi:tRNA-binding EMAP/Myf-like protein